MKVVELELNKSMFCTVDAEQKIKTLSTGIYCYETMIEILAHMQEFSKKEHAGVEDGLDLLMLVEPILTLNTTYLERFSQGILGTTPAIRKRLASFLVSLDSTKTLVSKNTEIFLPFTKEELDNVIQSLGNTVGNLIAFIFYQFKFDDLYLAKDSSEVTEINDIVDVFMRQNGYSIDDMIALARTLRVHLIECNPVMNIFEKYPEYLEPFVELLGQDLYDCQDATPSQIKAVVEGEMSTEELLEQLSNE